MFHFVGVLITHEALDWSRLKQYTHKDTLCFGALSTKPK
jgi:hypothetical protein